MIEFRWTKWIVFGRVRVNCRAVRARRAGRNGPIASLSGRNQLRGIVDEVRIEDLLAQVRLRIGDRALTAVMTRDGVADLRLRRGEPAIAGIKSTEVMLAHEAD
jgi:molybdopterin-binding protein